MNNTTAVDYPIFLMGPVIPKRSEESLLTNEKILPPIAVRMTLLKCHNFVYTLVLQCKVSFE